jgi:hypothetical protein
LRAIGGRRRTKNWIRLPKGFSTTVFTSTRWSCPSGPTIERMPQSGLAIIRPKLRSVTSPQAAIIGSSGFIDSANTG